jgi:hypothetical protein
MCVSTIKCRHACIIENLTNWLTVSLSVRSSLVLVLLLQTYVVQVSDQLIRKCCWVAIQILLNATCSPSCTDTMSVSALTGWHKRAKAHDLSFSWAWQVQPNEFLALAGGVQNVVLLQNVWIQVTHQGWLLSCLRLSISLSDVFRLLLVLSKLTNFFLGTFRCVRCESLSDSIVNCYLCLVLLLCTSSYHVTYFTFILLFGDFRLNHEAELSGVNSLIIKVGNNSRDVRDTNLFLLGIILEVSYNLHNFLLSTEAFLSWFMRSAHPSVFWFNWLTTWTIGSTLRTIKVNDTLRENDFLLVLSCIWVTSNVLILNCYVDIF